MAKRKIKLTPEERVVLVESYLNGEDSLNRLAGTVGINESTLKRWIMIYETKVPLVYWQNERIHIIPLRQNYKPSMIT